MSGEILIVGGLVLGPDGPVEADVRIVDDRIVEVAPGLAGSSDGSSATTIDATGAWVGPGFVDLHVHLREPGQEWKEDIASGSAAAAAGGYTAVVAMPNTDPAIDAGHLARFVTDRGREAGLVEVRPAGAISLGLAGEKLAHLDELWRAGVRLFTDDGATVTDAGLLRRAMDYLAERGGLVAQHAEDLGLSRHGHMHEGAVSGRLGMAAIPREAETVVVARDLAIAELTGCRYHVQHVSAAATLDLVAAAKARGLPVTVEVTPHHLAFDHRAVETMDPVFKMYPPLRDTEDREALRAALRDGLIDAVATDHAPHAAHEKEVPFDEAPRGVIGLETAAAVVRTEVELGIERFFEVLSITPARLGAFERHGHPIAAGAPANVVVFAPDERWVPAGFESRSENSPFLGKELQGRVLATIFEGRPTVVGAKVLR